MKIVYYDTHCFYCNSFILLILDKTKDISISSINSERLKDFRREHPDLDSVIFQDEEEFFIKSTAVIKILKYLGGAYVVVGTLYSFIPRFIRDWEYDLFAKFRYRLAFGATCRLMTSEEKERFIN